MGPWFLRKKWFLHPETSIVSRYSLLDFEAASGRRVRPEFKAAVDEKVPRQLDIARASNEPPQRPDYCDVINRPKEFCYATVRGSVDNGMSVWTKRSPRCKCLLSCRQIKNSHTSQAIARNERDVTIATAFREGCEQTVMRVTTGCSAVLNCPRCPRRRSSGRPGPSGSCR